MKRFQLSTLMIAFAYFFVSSYASLCNKNTYDVEACIHKTTIQCFWNVFTDSCEKANGVDYGCDNSLNRMSCIRQLYSFDNSSILKQCFFGQRCQNASPQQLNMLGCQSDLSKYACISITTPGVQCQWVNNQCLDIFKIASTQIQVSSLERCMNSSTSSSEDEIDQPDDVEEVMVESQTSLQQPKVKAQFCQETFNQSVNSNVCANLAIKQPCQHGSWNDSFRCIKANFSTLQTMNCSSSGLNWYGCQSIGTLGQNCVFLNGQCQMIISTILQNITCRSLINRQACIGFTDSAQTCQWNSTSNSCQNITTFGLPCQSLTNVSISTCASSTNKCTFNTTSGGCRQTNPNQDSCSSIGISQLGCLSLNQTCRYDTQCQQMSTQDLNTYRCSSNLTKLSCLNLITPGQLCQWSDVGQNCTNINISPDFSCTSFVNVNGNVCQAIIKDGCKYDQKNYNCINSNITTKDKCSAPFLNIVGCVNVLHKSSVCGWIEDYQQCYDITVISGITRCTDLTNVNPAACQQVYRPEINPDERNCRYNAISRGCVTYAAFDVNANCNDTGLNQYGCVSVVKNNSWCRWQNNACATIHFQVEVQSTHCLNLQQVNAAVCSLALAGGERCKYEPISNNCITTVDIYVDECSTIGLNSYGCEAIKKYECYFDSKLLQCRPTSLLNSTTLSTFFSAASCKGQYLTQYNCLSVQTINQDCHWDNRQSVCVDVNLTPDTQCGDLPEVNSNVCAAVNVTIVNPLLSYCVYDTENYRCAVVLVVGLPCDTPGLNIYSCSAMTSVNSYCYYNYMQQRCLEFGTYQTNEAQVSLQWKALQLDCNSLSSRSCPLNNWSPNWKCLYNNTLLTGLCSNIDFQNDPNKAQYNCSYFQNPNLVLSPYVCAAVNTPQDYCQYDSSSQRCQTVVLNQVCTTQFQNIKACLFRTLNDYCQWLPDLLQCVQIIPSQRDSKMCTDLINQNTCTKFTKQICQFNETLSLCQNFIPVTNMTTCVDLATPNMTYNRLACQEVTRPGYFCEYNTLTRACQDQTSQQGSCLRLGSNKGSCFAKTLYVGCFWNQTTKTCQDISKLLVNGQLNVSCSYGLNRIACLFLTTNTACQWDYTLGQCTTMVITNQTGCADLNQILFSQNAFSCQTITKLGQNCYYDKKTGHCQNFTQPSLQQCSSYVRNINSCLQLTTQAYVYCKWDPVNFLCLTVSQANLSKQICSDPVNQNICLGTTSGQCVWNNTLSQCSNFTTGNLSCTNFTNGNDFYNRMTCVLQFYQGLIQNPNPVDQNGCRRTHGIQHDMCAYNPATHLCIQLIKYSYKSPTIGCNANPIQTCDPNLNYFACTQMTVPECYFNGQCHTVTSSLYNQILCSQASYSACSQITTPGQLCCINSYNQVCEQYPGTSITYPSNTCSIGDSSNSVNQNVCSSLAYGHCQWDSLQWFCFDANATLTYLCSALGINNGTCTDYTNNVCTFNFTSFRCSGNVTYYPTCNEVNLLGLSSSQVQTLCSEVTLQACYFDPNLLQCIVVTDFSLIPCNATNSFNLLACQNITHLFTDGSQNYCAFDIARSQCDNKFLPDELDEQSGYCQYSNKFSCLNYTTSARLCVWRTDPVTLLASCKEYRSDSLNSQSSMSHVGTCQNVSSQACLKITQGLQCKLINNNQCLDINLSDTIGNNCSQMLSINSLVCANFTLLNGVKQYCEFSQATSLTGSYCYSAGSNSLCSAPGLSIFSCIEDTWLTNGTLTIGGQCLWNTTTTQCQTIQDPSYYISGNCTILNKIACPNNLNLLQPCVWSDSSVSCKPLTGSVRCSAYNSTIVSPYVCSNASDVACKFDPMNNVCQVILASDIPVLQCSNQGMNKIACLTRTPGLHCWWISSQQLCYAMDESANHCNDELNVLGCIGTISFGQNCYYDTVANTCQNFTVSSTTTLAQVTNSALKFNAQTCANITSPGAYTAYDVVNFVCISLSSTNNKCSLIGINQLGCLSKTNQQCSYTINSGCTKVLQLKQLTCDASYNKIVCQTLTGQGCYFTNNLCSNVNQTAKCADLQVTSLVTNAEACARINHPSDFCQYDSVNLRCQVMQNNKSLCQTLGINQQGCQNQTYGFCKFDNILFQCNAESAYNQYLCTDLVNYLNCVSITTSGQICQYNQQCQPFIYDDTVDCPTTSLVNAQACVAITKPKQSCIYNVNTFMCQHITNNTLCLDPYMNKVGCLQITAPNQKCEWDDQNSQCYGFFNTQQNCSSPVNKQACLSIDPINYNCIWQDGSCNALTGSPNCADLIFINSPLACQLANDACRYNTTTKSCNIVTAQDPLYLCNQTGLSQTACTNNTQDKMSCVFDQSCFLPSIIYICTQAMSLIECVDVINACQWLNNKCLPFTLLNVSCDSFLPQLVTKYVCQDTITSTPQNTCSYITTTSVTSNGTTIVLTAYCKETTPINCFSSEDQRSCIHLAGQPCIWNPVTQLCSLLLVQQYPGIYTCANLGGFVSQRTCVDLIRIGEYCVYDQNQCIRVDPTLTTTYCNSSINFDACVQINSGNQRCIWKVIVVSNVIQNMIMNDGVETYPYIDYYQGKCQTFTDVSTTICSNNLNIQSCFAITTPGEYCQWRSYLCSPILLSNNIHPPPIEMQDFTLVNPNVCTLVNLVGQQVKYNFEINACVISDSLKDRCLTPGLNKAGCLNIASESCQWSDTNLTCGQYIPISNNITSCSMIQNNVNSFVCSQIQTGILCTYDPNAYLCIDILPGSICNGQGINQVGCLSLISDACVWQRNTCYTNIIVQDITSCENVPYPTNPYSCQQVSFFNELCKYDAVNKKCVSFKSITTESCLTQGINLVGCSQITSSYCIFADGQCNYFTNKDSTCHGVGQGNAGSCSLTKQSVDKCKYDFLNLACGPSNVYDVCSTPGLNSEACKNLGGCLWQDKQKICQCASAQNLVPDCSSIVIAYDCKARRDCFFTTKENNEATFKNFKFNYTLAQQKDLHGTCKTLQCSDMKLDLVNTNSTYNSSDIFCRGNTDPYGLQCLASSTQFTCRTVQSCEEIEIGELEFYQGCSSFYFGNRPCQKISQNKNCSSFSCSSYLTSADCNQKYCVFTIPNCNTSISQCLDIQCEDLSVNNCSGIINSRSCFFINNTCQGISTCDQINLIKTDLVKKEQTCNQVKEGSRQCGWVQTSLKLSSNQCSSISCRYVGYNEQTCSGMHVLGEVCIMVKSNCQSCEEIVDSCTCLKKSPYCAYDSINSRCLSVPCSSYNKKKQCLSASLNGQFMCQYIQNTKQCMPLCSRTFSKTICNLSFGCIWQDDRKSCEILQKVVRKVKSTIATAKYIQHYTFSVLPFILAILCVWY